MKSYDIVGYAEDGAAYCVGCVEAGEIKHLLDQDPIFADQAGDLTCDLCFEHLIEEWDDEGEEDENYQKYGRYDSPPDDDDEPRRETAPHYSIGDVDTFTVRPVTSAEIDPEVALYWIMTADQECECHEWKIHEQLRTSKEEAMMRARCIKDALQIPTMLIEASEPEVI